MKKYIGTVIGALIFGLLMSYDVLAHNPPSKMLDMVSSIGGFLMSAGIVIGGAISGFVIQNFIITRHEKAFWGAVVASVVIARFAFICGIVFGTFGGAIGIGFGNAGRDIGIFLAIIVVIVTLECTAAGIGAALSSLIGRRVSSR